MPVFGGGGAVDRSRRERARLLARLRRRHGRSVALPACHQGGGSGGTGLALALRALRLGRARLRGRVGRARAGHPRSAWSSGFGVGGVSALRDATRANDEVASFGSQRVRSRRRRSVGGRERRTEPLDGVQKASPRVSSTARNKRRAFRRSTAVVPAATPQHRSRAERGLIRFFARRENQKWRVRTRGSAAAVADASVPLPRGDDVRRRL